MLLSTQPLEEHITGLQPKGMDDRHKLYISQRSTSTNTTESSGSGGPRGEGPKSTISSCSLGGISSSAASSSSSSPRAGDAMNLKEGSNSLRITAFTKERRSISSATNGSTSTKAPSFCSSVPDASGLAPFEPPVIDSSSSECGRDKEDDCNNYEETHADLSPHPQSQNAPPDAPITIATVNSTEFGKATATVASALTSAPHSGSLPPLMKPPAISGSSSSLQPSSKHMCVNCREDCPAMSIGIPCTGEECTVDISRKISRREKEARHAHVQARTQAGLTASTQSSPSPQENQASLNEDDGGGSSSAGRIEIGVSLDDIGDFSCIPLEIGSDMRRKKTDITRESRCTAISREFNSFFAARNLDTGELVDIREIEHTERYSDPKLIEGCPWKSFWKEKRLGNEDLWSAVERGNVADIQACLKSCDINAKLLDNWTALHLAACKPNRPDVAELLIKHDADINACTKTLYTPLHLASSRGRFEMVKSLIALNANIHMVTDTGDTVCHLASENGHVEIAKYLLGLFPGYAQKTNNLGQSPSCVAHSLEVLRLFQKNDIKSDNYSRTPFENILLHNSRKDVVQKFLRLSEVNGSSARKKKDSTSLYQGEPDQEAPSSTLLTRTSSAQKKRRAKPFVTLKKEAAMEEIGIDTFWVKSILGKGSFGEVYLVVHRKTNESYAMKVLQKSKIMGRNLVRYALTERNVLSYIRHPFIVSLHFAFQTSAYLVLVQEFCPGGNLQQLIQKERKLKEPLARLYSAELLLALEHLHERNIIYRDLKPDNVVLDIRGHVLLIDFGLSKEGVNDARGATSFCGSVAYLAPEMLRRRGHGHTVDLYGLGVVLYEMITGMPPFFCNDREQLFHNIQHGKLRFSSTMSPVAFNLIESLMDRDPFKRVGFHRTRDVRDHDFFKNIQWDVILRKEFTPLPAMSQRLEMMRKSDSSASPPLSTNPLMREDRAERRKLRGGQKARRHTVQGWEFTRHN